MSGGVYGMEGVGGGVGWKKIKIVFLCIFFCFVMGDLVLWF